MLTRITASVGAWETGSVSKPADVKTIQDLLTMVATRLQKPKLKPRGVNGSISKPSSRSSTVQAIREFQKTVVGLTRPDGRVDPGGRTLKKLQSVLSGATTATIDPDLRRKFVDPRVKEKPNTTRIINKIMPHFAGTDVKVIAGWLDDEMQFWKVNYHWDYLVYVIDHSSKLDISQKHKICLQAIRGKLMTTPPNPKTGYCDFTRGGVSSQVGDPKDSSDVKTIRTRHGILKQSKRDFASIVKAADLVNKSNIAKSKQKRIEIFGLASAPVASPGTSKHGEGYAVDIKGMKGNNAQVTRICDSLGATLVFPETNHVHVEFKDGVRAR